MKKIDENEVKLLESEIEELEKQLRPIKKKFDETNRQLGRAKCPFEAGDIISRKWCKNKIYKIIRIEFNRLSKRTIYANLKLKSGKFSTNVTRIDSYEDVEIVED